MTRGWADILRVPCPTCGAPAGEWCGWPGGSAPLAHPAHLTRIELYGLVESHRPADAPGGPETAADPKVAPEPTPASSEAGRPVPPAKAATRSGRRCH